MVKSIVEGRGYNRSELSNNMSRYLLSIFSCFLFSSSFAVGQYLNVVVDLSHWNSDVNFTLAKQDGILGIIHKATQGLDYVDPKYEENRKAAEEEEMLWGAYHFGIGANGKDQAQHFLNTVGNTTNVLLALDIEENTSGDNITPEQAEDFVEEVYGVTGRLPIVYGSTFFLNDFSSPILTKCYLWIARYGAEPQLPTGRSNWTLWQYTDGTSGSEPHEVQGIGNCDRDKFNGTLEELKKFWIAGAY